MKFTCFLVILITGLLLFSSGISSVSLGENPFYPSQTISEATSNSDAGDTLRILSHFFHLDFSLQNFADFNSSTLLPSLVFDALVRFSNDSSQILPSLATSWVVSLDSRDWTFFLREDVVFHDGSPFNASAVKFSYDRIIDPSHPAYINESRWDDIWSLESVEILNEFSVAFHFSDPYPPFLYNEASDIRIYSPNCFTGSFLTNPIGTGRFQFLSADANVSTYYLARNDQYFRPLLPFVNLSYRIFFNASEFEAALVNHEGDIGIGGGWYLPEIDPYWQHLFAYKGHNLGWLNHSNPYLANLDVRLALNHAIDKVDFHNTFRESYEPYNEITSTIHCASLYHDNTTLGYPFDLTLANQLLDNAGFPRGSDGYRFELQLSGAFYKANMVDYVQTRLDLIGINTTIIECEDWLPDKAVFDIFLSGVGIGLDPSYVRHLLHSSGSLNFGGFSDSLLDQLIMNGQYTPVDQEREVYYHQIQQREHELAPYLLLNDRQGFPYLVTPALASLIQWNGNGLDFLEEESSLFTMLNIPVDVNPLYFQLTDLVVSPTDFLHDSSLTVSLAYQAHHLLPSLDDTGKYYRLSTSDLFSTDYLIRFYYDRREFSSVVNLEELALFEWDFTSKSWIELDPVFYDNNFHYFEVSLTISTDPLILRFDRSLKFLITYTYLLPYLVLLGTIISFGVAVIFVNRIFSRNLKEEFFFQ